MDVIVYAIEIRDLRLPRNDKVNLVRVGVYERERPGDLRPIQSSVNIGIVIHADGLEVVPVEHPDVVLSEEEVLLPISAEKTL